MKVRCPACDKVQEDGGMRNTCERCGFQPVPSYSYPQDSPFYPDTKRPPRKPSLASLGREVAKARKLRRGR